MAPGEDTDSGLSSMSSSNRSLTSGSKDKDISPEKAKVEFEDDDDLDDEDLDETLSERLWGLTEMFPEGVRNVTSTVVSGTCTGMKGLYGFSRTATWLFFSTSVLLFAPLIFEVERAQMEEVQRSQQKQVLLDQAVPCREEWDCCLKYSDKKQKLSSEEFRQLHNSNYCVKNPTNLQH